MNDIVVCSQTFGTLHVFEWSYETPPQHFLHFDVQHPPFVPQQIGLEEPILTFPKSFFGSHETTKRIANPIEESTRVVTLTDAVCFFLNWTGTFSKVFSFLPASQKIAETNLFWVIFWESSAESGLEVLHLLSHYFQFTFHGAAHACDMVDL